MKHFSALFISSALCIGLFASCAKQGPAGDIGPQGPQGPLGNANVQPVFDSTNSSSNWNYITGNYWYVSFANQYLTSSFIKSGGIAEVFMSTDNGKVWSNLPTTYYADTVHNAQMTYTTSANTVTLYFTWNDTKQHTDPVTTYGGTCIFNVVCITPAVMKKYPGTNWSNYQSVSIIPELGLKSGVRE